MATTTMVTDLVAAIGGRRVEVHGLMGPGVDPHLYKATASDVTRLQQAAVVFYSGLMLEGKMEELFTQLGRTRRVTAVTSALPRERLLTPAQFQGHPDPHVWFDVPLWSLCIPVVVEALSAADPDGAAYYAEQGRKLQERWAELHDWALRKAQELPPERRVLVTSHDAFNYFGRAYGFKVVGLQGISTVSEAGLADMARLVDFVRATRLKAVFVESSVPHQTLERISKDAGVRIGGELFSDAMGTPGQLENGYDLGTYEGMIRHNLTTIVEALR